jgi:hypothetical protein
LFSLSFTIIGDLFSARERGRFMGLFGATFGLASAIGPLVGGFFTDHGTVTIAGWEIAGWRWVFYVNLPLGLCSLLLILAKMPPLRPERGDGKIDYLGAMLFVAASVPLLLVLTWGGQSYAWTSPQILGLIAMGLVTLAAFVVVEKSVPDPLLPLSLFRNRVFTTANLAGFCIGMSFLGVIMFMPLVTLAALLWLAAINTHTAPVDLSFRLFLVGVGLGPSQSLLNLAVQNAVPATQLGIATGASQFFRQMGSVVGLALFGALLTDTLTDELSRRVPEVSAFTTRIDLSQVQSQALDPHRMRREFMAQAEAQYQRMARTHENDPNARQAIFAAASARATHLETGMKESFAAAITYLNRFGFWIVAAALVLTLFIPAIPLRETGKMEEPVEGETVPAASD